MSSQDSISRQKMDVDIVCVGFGPAMGGFLTTLTRFLATAEGQRAGSSRVAPGMPLQVICYERADDLGFGVSGVVTPARGIRQSFSDEQLAQIPMACPVKREKVAYLLDPVGASRRSAGLQCIDALIKSLRFILPFKEHAFELPYVPPFLRKEGGYLFSIGQFNQWVGTQVMNSGLVQVWPGMPVAEPLLEQDAVAGVRLVDQGTNKEGQPDAGYMPGMDIKAALTVVGDGPVGAVGQQLDEHFGLPEGRHQREWAVGMKMVVELPQSCPLEPGTVLHTFGYPEPEIFGFMYVYPDRLASLGIFVPSWFQSPVRTSYRYLQYWMMHPYIWRHLRGGVLRSWGAKSLQESGKRGEPYLAGSGYARIGEGSGSTNVLTGSGVDEAWTTGVQLAQGVISLLEQGQPFTRKNLERAYVERRRQSWVEKEAQAAERARDGFQKGVLQGLMGMALAGLSGGRLYWPAKVKRLHAQISTVEDYFKGRVPPDEIETIRREARTARNPLHVPFLEKSGWPSIPYDGKLLISHQDALLLGGKVQAPAGYADHVIFRYPHLCESCGAKVCIELCSAQAISVPQQGGVPEFDREKCIHCGACLWNCAAQGRDNPELGNVRFGAGAGGLHSAEN